MVKQSIYKLPKRNKGFVLIYTLFIFIFTFTLLLTLVTYLHYLNVKTIKHYESLKYDDTLDEMLFEISTNSSSLKNVGAGYITNNKGIVYSIDNNQDGTYTLIGYLIVKPEVKKYYIFHNGYYDKTDYDYQILEEGYLKENE